MIIIKRYKRATKGIEDRINEEGIKYEKRADILDRMEIQDTSMCFVTLKERPQLKLYQPPHSNTNNSR